jgi:hypothetical protein
VTAVVGIEVVGTPSVIVLEEASALTVVSVVAANLGLNNKPLVLLLNVCCGRRFGLNFSVVERAVRPGSVTDFRRRAAPLL